MPDMRTCIACGKTDADPKHQHVQIDGSSAFHHHDCGTMLDPACGICTVLMTEAPKPKTGGKDAMIRGDELRTHLESLPPRAWTDHGNGKFSYVDGRIEIVDGHPRFVELGAGE